MSTQPDSTYGHIEGLYMIPDHVHDGMRLWIEKGVVPGSFLRAVLVNDFMGACSRADDTNRERLFSFAKYLYNYAPPACFGSPEAVKLWAEQGGLDNHYS